MAEFKTKADATAAEVQSNVMEWANEQRRSRARITETVGTASTPIAHGLNGIPVGIAVLPSADARVWRSADSDETHVFLQASVEVECLITVEL